MVIIDNRVANKVPWADKLFFTIPNWTKNENCSDHWNMSEEI